MSGTRRKCTPEFREQAVQKPTDISHSSPGLQLRARRPTNHPSPAGPNEPGPLLETAAHCPGLLDHGRDPRLEASGELAGCRDRL